MKINHALVLKLSQCRKTSIQDPLLQGIFNCDGYNFKGIPIHPLTGDGFDYSFSRIYITYLIQRLFQIVRLPGYEESVSFNDDSQLHRALESITDREIESHLQELYRLYVHTQRELAKALSEPTVKVYRGFKNDVSELITISVARANQLGEKTAKIYGNILDSFATYHKTQVLDGTESEAQIFQTVPVENILLCHHTIDGLNNARQNLFVINRSPTGLLDIPLSDIKIINPRPILSCNTQLDHYSIFRDLYRHRDSTYITHSGLCRHSARPIETVAQRAGKLLDSIVGKRNFSPKG